jgi:hypothetical protein
MPRRRLLQGGAVAAGVGVAAGLDWLLDGQSGNVDHTPEELPEVVVEEQRFQASTYRAEDSPDDRSSLVRTVRVERGQVRLDVYCAEPIGRQPLTEDLSAEAYGETQRLVAELELATWRDRYDCQAGCTGRRTNELTVVLDGREYGTVYDPGADIPAGIGRLRNHLGSHEQRFSDRFGAVSHPCEG